MKPGENMNMFWNSRSCISSGNPTTKMVVTCSKKRPAPLFVGGEFVVVVLLLMVAEGDEDKG